MKSPKRRIYEWVSKRFMNDCSSYNDLDVRKSCRSKEQARATFEKLDIPHAKGLIFLNPLKAHRFAQKHGFPLVIKPNVSGFSRGSHFPINNYLELWRAIFLAKLWWPTTVVEQFLQGKNYRVLVVKGEVMSVLERFPPFVRGDGVKTINQLIDEENSVRKTMQLYPCISPLPKNLLTKRHLKKQGYSLDSVPENGEDATLFYRIALEPGGVVAIVDKANIPTTNTQLFTQLLDELGANILGIDVIMEQGIDVDYRDQRCIFLEVNSRPYLKMHDYPRWGTKENLDPYFEQLETLEVAHSDTY